jgi:hypothetical protein
MRGAVHERQQAQWGVQKSSGFSPLASASDARWTYGKWNASIVLLDGDATREEHDRVEETTRTTPRGWTR